MKKRVLTEYKAEQFLSKYVKVAKNQLVKDLKEIKIRTPLVLKIISPDALHKTDIGGVKIVRSQEEVEKEYTSLINIAKKKKLKLEGILVQEFHEGEQLIIGIKKDPVFNHVIAFGLGGIFTEILNDISIRKCPITEKDAEEMIHELKSYKIFHDFRGKKLNVASLKKILISVSQIPEKHKGLEEMDINPLILNEKEGLVADARIVFSK